MPNLFIWNITYTTIFIFLREEAITKYAEITIVGESFSNISIENIGSHTELNCIKEIIIMHFLIDY